MKAGQKTEGRQKRLSRQALGKLHEAAGLPVLPLDLQRWTIHKVSIPALLPTQGTRPLHKHDPDARFCNPLPQPTPGPTWALFLVPFWAVLPECVVLCQSCKKQGSGGAGCGT